MLCTIAVMLLILCPLSLTQDFAVNKLAQVLLMIAIAAVLIPSFSGRRHSMTRTASGREKL
jgi:hypothetical protein